MERRERALVASDDQAFFHAVRIGGSFFIGHGRNVHIRNPLPGYTLCLVSIFVIFTYAADR